MTQPNILSLAKQGNSQAITALIARPLQAKGIIPQASLKDQCLRVILESMEVPDQQVMVQFIHRGMMKLRIESIKTVKIYGRKAGQDSPAWSQELHLEYSHENYPQVKHIPIKDWRLQENQTPSNGSTANSKSSNLNQKLEAADANNCILVVSRNSQTTKNHGKQTRIDSKQKQKHIGLSVISKVLVCSLLLQTGFYILFVIYDVVWVASYYIYRLIDIGDITGIMAYLLKLLVVSINGLMQPLEVITIWINRLLIIVILIWLYRLHASLRITERNYPISPWGAIARFIIPFYSFWGIWNIFATLAQQFKLQGSQQMR